MRGVYEKKKESQHWSRLKESVAMKKGRKTTLAPSERANL